MGRVQDSPVSTNMISNACMIYPMKVHMVCYNFGSKKISKSKIHIFTISGHMSLKPAIVTCHLKFAKQGTPRNSQSRIDTHYYSSHQK